MENKHAIISKIGRLLELHRQQALGGEKMPEDENPGLPRDSEQNFFYFTLPMALNYQRDSYKLWESANRTFKDRETAWAFAPDQVVKASGEDLRKALLKHKVALQPNRHVQIWRTISATFHKQGFRDFFKAHDYDVARIKAHMQENKKDFPYLSGPKILNYWLYSMGEHTDLKLAGRRHITIAADTHVIQASVKLGIIGQPEAARADIREHLAAVWDGLLKDTDILPIDVHTPLWLWSRGGFRHEL